MRIEGTGALTTVGVNVRSQPQEGVGGHLCDDGNEWLRR